MIQQLLDVMEKMTDVHKELLDNAHKKTELIEANNVDEFSKILMKERKFVQTIEQLEQKRQQITDEIFSQLNIKSEEKTVTELLNHITNEKEKSDVENSVVKLIEVIVKLKETENLNQELIHQSMQFVQLSLDMLQPTTKNINYNENKQDKNIQKRSVFDSKA